MMRTFFLLQWDYGSWNSGSNRMDLRQQHAVIVHVTQALQDDPVCLVMKLPSVSDNDICDEFDSS